MFLNVHKIGKLVEINDNHHDIIILADYCSLRLLLAVKIGRYRLLSKKISRLMDKTS